MSQIETFYDVMRRQGITRRSFMKYCTLTATALGLGPAVLQAGIICGISRRGLGRAVDQPVDPVQGSGQPLFAGVQVVSHRPGSFRVGRGFPRFGTAGAI